LYVIVSAIGESCWQIWSDDIGI